MTTRVSQWQKKSFSGPCGAREDNRGRHTDNPAGCQSIRINEWPTCIIPHSLHRMPFLLQPSQFILAWDRHQICWFTHPVAWLHTQCLGCHLVNWLCYLIKLNLLKYVIHTYCAQVLKKLNLGNGKKANSTKKNKVAKKHTQKSQITCKENVNEQSSVSTADVCAYHCATVIHYAA